MLHKFSAWTHLSNFDQSEHKNWTYSVINAWTWREKSKATVFPACSSWLNFRVRGQFKIKVLIVRHTNTTYFIWIFKKIKLEPAIIWKPVPCQRITSKKHLTSMGRHLSTRYSQVILVSGYLVLTAVNGSQNWRVSVFLCSDPKLARKYATEHWSRSSKIINWSADSFQLCPTRASRAWEPRYNPVWSHGLIKEGCLLARFHSCYHVKRILLYS